MKNTTKLLEGSYAAPEIHAYSVEVESGFVVSQNPGLSYGDAGNAGTIENGNSYEL